MTTRQELLTHWQEQLLTAEEAEREVASWRMRIRVRLYRFLLAMYGRAAWSGSPQDADEVLDHPSQLLVSDDVDLPESPDEATLLDHGKAPRTRAEILLGLKNVRGLSDELAPPGPLQHGLPADAPVAVAACKKLPRANRLIWQLRAAGFAPVIERRGELLQIFVTAAAAPAAIKLLAELEPVRRPAPGRQVQVKVRGNGPMFLTILCGFVALPLTCHLISRFSMYDADPASYPLPTLDRLVVLIVATVIVDLMFAFCVWLTWRQFRSDEHETRPATSPWEKRQPKSQQD